MNTLPRHIYGSFDHFATRCRSYRSRAKGLTVGGQQEVGGILLREPFDLVDLLLNLQTLQVVKLRLVALEGAVNIVLPSTLGLALALDEEEGKEKPLESCLLAVDQLNFGLLSISNVTSLKY